MKWNENEEFLEYYEDELDSCPCDIQETTKIVVEELKDKRYEIMYKLNLKYSDIPDDDELDGYVEYLDYGGSTLYDGIDDVRCLAEEMKNLGDGGKLDDIVGEKFTDYLDYLIKECNEWCYLYDCPEEVFEDWKEKQSKLENDITPSEYTKENVKENTMSNDKELNYQDNKEFMKYYNNELTQNKSNMIRAYTEMYETILSKGEGIQETCSIQVGTREGWQEEIMDFEKGKLSWEDLLSSAEFWEDVNAYDEISDLTGEDFNGIIKNIKEIYDDNEYCLENPDEMFEYWSYQQQEQAELEPEKTNKKIKM